ncbi:MAG: hypothetical protein HY716_12700 [Planctomycetes bacterium]|nr:hypothetical protein [Planctomycetota bacterium]
MTVIEILDAAFKLYRDNFFLFLGIMAVPYVPIVVLFAASYGALFTAVPEAQGAPSKEMAAGVIVLFCGMMAAVLLLHLIAIPIAKGALSRAIADRYLGRTVSLQSAYAAIFAIFWKYLLTTFLVGLLVGLGAMFCLVPGIYVAVLFAFVPPIMIVEGVTGTDAMSRSKDLSGGHRWRVLGLWAITVVVGFILGGVIQMAYQWIAPLWIESEALRTVLSQSASWMATLLVEPLWAVAWVLLYFDVRVRKEAFDLQLAAARMAS